MRVCNLHFVFGLAGMCHGNGNAGDRYRRKAFRAPFEEYRYMSTVSRFPSS